MADFLDFLNPISSLIDNIFGIIATNKNNKSNQEINQQNIDYNTAMTREAWERDDSAHQREVADLEAAGLSPLAALGGAGVTSPLGAPSPISMQAPSIDSNSMIQNAIKKQQLAEEKRHNEKSEAQKDIDLQNQAAEIKVKADNLDLENKKLNQTIKHQADLIDLQSKQLAEQIRSNKSSETLKDKEIKEREAEYQSQLFMKEVQHITGGVDVPYEEITNYDKYIAAVRLRNLRFSQFIDKIQATSESSSEGSNTSKSKNAGAGISGGITLPGSPVGGNVGLNGNGGYSEAEGKFRSESKNISELQQRDYEKFMRNNPVPVFVTYDEKGYKHAKSYRVE